MKISLIAAHDKNLGIGFKNKLPWDIPGDLKHFRDLTKNHVMIMGSRTFESIGRALPGRISIVVTKNKNYEAPGAIVVHSIEEALQKASTHLPSLGFGEGDPKGRERSKDDEVFVIGGAVIFEQFLKKADKLYMTVIDKKYQADTFFPKYDNLFKKVTFREEHEHNSVKYTYINYER